MRQQNDTQFIIALNNLATSNMTEDDISLINSRKTNEKHIPEEAIRLFDGLVNEACGVLKHIIFDENNTPKLICLNFGENMKIGIKMKTKYKELMHNLKINLNLIPIPAIDIIINTKENYQIVRKQIPVIPAEALNV
ncbi:hypothetical protein TSAR_009366 [Trichomalopsis sarcophagae]|uniref:Uncharacterized protein n=1 Tax=Trichomalopsis sarcophagae TaxID=543379 RepID=A0A232EGK4_9HYME|nr:hypothetical protein TSAR_009366 [Trichomalopsis sarcophagae]